MTIPLTISSLTEVISSGNIAISWSSYVPPVNNTVQAAQSYKLYYRLTNPTLSSTTVIDGKTIGYEYLIATTTAKTYVHPLASFGTTIASSITSNAVDVSFVVKAYIQGEAGGDISSCLVLGNFNAVKWDSEGGGIQCRSTKTQVINNVLYDEGEVLWWLNPVLSSNTPSAVVTKNEYSLWARVNIDVSSKGNPAETDLNLQGTTLIGVGSTDGPTTFSSNAIRVSTHTGKVLNAFAIPKSGPNYNNTKPQLTLRGVITNSKDSNSLYLGSNNTSIAGKPVITKVTLPATFSSLNMTAYDGHIQKHAPGAPLIFLYNAGYYNRYAGTTPYAIYNLSRTNLIALDLDNNSNTRVLLRSSDASPNADKTVLGRGFYGYSKGPDGALFVGQNKITNNSSEPPSYICEVGKRWDNPNFPYAALPKTTPKTSRLLGISADFRRSPSIGGYYLWACADTIFAVVRYKWNGTNFESSSLTLRGGSGRTIVPRSIVSDGNNNIWAAGKFDALAKIYNTVGDANVRYPQSLSAFIQSPYGSNQKYIEYFLTRDHLLMNATLRQTWLNLVESNYGADTQSVIDNLGRTPTFNRYLFGIRVKGSTIEQKVANIRNFVETNNNLTGRYIYSRMGSSDLFPNVSESIRFLWIDKRFTTNSLGETKPLVGFLNNSDSGEMGADWSGTTQASYSRSIELLGEGSLNNDGGTETGSTPPTLSASIFTSYSTSPLNESFFGMASTGVDSLTGYDNFSVGIRAESTVNDYRLSSYHFNTDDYAFDIGSITANVTLTAFVSSTGVNGYLHTYDDPNKSGHPLAIVNERSLGEGGKTISVRASGTYLPWNGGATLVLTSPITSVTVLERWPTARFELESYDLTATRQSWWGYGFVPSSTYIRPVSTEYVDGDNYYQSTSGTDPLSCDFLDYSIARTWPISAWWFTAGNGTSATMVTNMDVTTAGADYQLTGVKMWDVLYTKPGVYWPTLYVRASNTGTYSNILTTFTSENSASYISLSQRVEVLEYEPFANFFVVSGVTHLSSYSDNISAFDPPSQTAYTNSGFISGYSPNLTVSFRSSSEPHSYPIEVWKWNFGDYYNELSNNVEVSATDVDILTQYPQWSNSKEGGYASHTYVMPGYYDVTLCVQASSSGTTSCATQNAIVYVEEIPPTACFEISANNQSQDVAISNGSTVAFIASCTVAGSFPICRIDYDFGDGSGIYTVTRILSSASMSISSTDPRNIIVTHEYSNAFGDNIVLYPSMTAYACNTNTSSVDDLSGSGSITIYPAVSSSQEAEARRLIGSRLENDMLLLTFEGQETNHIYNLALSSMSDSYISTL